MEYCFIQNNVNKGLPAVSVNCRKLEFATVDVNIYEQLKSCAPVAAISLHLLNYLSP